MWHEHLARAVHRELDGDDGLDDDVLYVLKSKIFKKNQNLLSRTVLKYAMAHNPYNLAICKFGDQRSLFDVTNIKLLKTSANVNYL